MPDLRQTRKKIKIALAVLLGVDVVALVVLLSPLVGSADSRRQELNRLWTELQLKTHQVEPLRDLDKKVKVANGQIADFYKTRFPARDSEILIQLGKLASANGVSIETAKYTVKDSEVGQLQRVEIDAALTGNYVSLARFINALERNDMVFIIDSITLGGEQNGIKLEMKLETYLKSGA